jgi:predicted dehydrogenase
VSQLSRRGFLRQTTAAAAVTAAVAGAGRYAPATLRGAGRANNRVRVAVMGVNGRGTDLARSFAQQAECEVACVCDVDSRAADKAAAAVAGLGARAPRTERDFRRVLDDASVDALVIAAPDHWHGPATILACAAGKHVYVEKPASHNAHEGELMVAAARKHRRIVQLGTQRRSMPGVVEAIAQLRAGAIGRLTSARNWYNNARGSIGRGRQMAAPAWLDYALWQGPAPERAYQDNLVHYNWHWFWHWGTGELGNNGIHGLDLCRWGLGVEYPRRVSSGGGRYHFQDDQETPDTHFAIFDFGGKTIFWEGFSCQPRGFEGSQFGVAFYGDRGSLISDGGGYKILDLQNKLVASGSGGTHDAPHVKNFLECVRDGRLPNADIEEGHKSTLLCHLGNIAYRTGQTLTVDPSTGRIRDNKMASALWSRKYRRGWEPKVG